MKLRYRFEQYSRNNVLLSILMVVLGILLFLWPGKTLVLAARIVGVALLAGAAVSFISWLRDRHRVGAGYAMLALALMCLAAGLVVLLAPKGLVALLPRLIGAAVALNGLLNLAQALELRRMGGAGWVSPLVMAVLTVLLGLFLVVHAIGAMKAAVMVIGGVLIYNGASNLWIEARYRRAGR